MEMCEEIQGRHPIFFHYENEKKEKEPCIYLENAHSNHDAIRDYLKRGVSYSKDELYISYPGVEPGSSG